jgi:hypothetical protein
MRIVIFFIGIFTVFQPIASLAQQADVKPKVVGWVENIRIQDVDMKLKAKMDTGAETSSIDAEIIEVRKVEKRRKGHTSDRVVFSMLDDDGQTKRIFERDIVRYVRIKKKGGGYIRRPVVEMRFCIAGRIANEEVNLANREGFIYPVLVGRNMMGHTKLYIDPSRTYLTRPNCPKN